MFTTREGSDWTSIWATCRNAPRRIWTPRSNVALPVLMWRGCSRAGGNPYRQPLLSCGCLKTERLRQHNLSHGHTCNGVSPTYESWAGMISRCENPNRPPGNCRWATRSEQQRNQRPLAPRRLRARAPSARGASSSRRPPQRCGDVEAVVRGRALGQLGPKSLSENIRRDYKVFGA
jgi:hypothetical protein